MRGREIMDVLEELGTRLAISFLFLNIIYLPQWPLVVLQQKSPMGPKSIFRIDRL